MTQTHHGTPPPFPTDTTMEALGAELRRLRAELDTAGQRLQVALAVLTTLSDHIEDHDNQALVITDIVDQWQRLTPAAQQAHARPHSPFPALAWHAWTYLDNHNKAAFTTHPDTDRLTGDQADQLLHRYWRRHLTRLRRTAPP